MSDAIRLAVTGDPADWILAVRAAKRCLERGYEDAIISFENGTNFSVRKTKAGVVVRQEVNRDAEDKTGA